MKQSLLVYLSILWLSTTCPAQNKTTLGLQAKVGTANYRPLQEGNKVQNLTTYGAGIYVDVPVSRHLSVRPQVGWLRKGYQQDSPVFLSSGGQPIGFINSKFSYDYLPVDLTLVYRARVEKVWRPFVQLGVRGSLLIDNQIKRTSTSQLVSASLDLDNYHRLTVGGLLAIGMEWNRLSFGLEANRDLSTFLTPPPIALFDDLRPKLGWYGFNVSYQLRNF